MRKPNKRFVKTIAMTAVVVVAANLVANKLYDRK